MSHVLLNSFIKLELTSQEFRLVGLALSGRLKDKDDIKAAAELNVRILELLVAKQAEAQELTKRALEVACDPGATK